MLSVIISREFLSNVLNLRFVVGLVLCVIISVACVMILTHDYQQEMTDYNLRINLQDEILSKYGKMRSCTSYACIKQLHREQPAFALGQNKINPFKLASLSLVY